MKACEIRIIVDSRGQASIKRPTDQPAIEAALIVGQVAVQLTAQAMSESGNPVLELPNFGSGLRLS